MRHFCIITNSDKGANAQIAQRAVQYLRAHDADCVILPNFLEETGGIRHFTAVQDIPKDAECAIVLGGDGTMIQAAIDLVHCRTDERSRGGYGSAAGRWADGWYVENG